MALTPEQLAKERKAEAQYNKIAEKIIQTQPWGQFYGLMKGAADFGEGMIKHQVCIAPDGRPISVAKTKHGRVLKSFIRPAHEHATKAFSQKKFGRGIVGLFGFGWIPNLVEQRRATCLDVVPSEFIKIAEDRKRAALPEKPQPTPEQIAKQEAEIKSAQRVVVAGEIAIMAGVTMVVVVIAYSIANARK